MQINTWLPVFTGFYGSIYEPDETNEIDYINEIRIEKGLSEVNYDDCEFNYNDYFNDISEQLTNQVESELKDFVHSIKFEKLHSPKFYNFESDSIHVAINPKSKSILNYIHKYNEDWGKYLEDHYTSRSGFISSYSNDSNSKDWNDDNLINGIHQLGAALNFICENEDVSELDLWDWIVGNVSLECTNYDELTNGGK